MKQSKVDELVETFYRHLTKDDYFKNMFAERNVDIEQLKERQKTFIFHLINDDTTETEQGSHRQVQKRHGFHTTSEHAELWLSYMEKAIDEMAFAPEVKEKLMTKINQLMGNVVKN